MKVKAKITKTKTKTICPYCELNGSHNNRRIHPIIKLFLITGFFALLKFPDFVLLWHLFTTNIAIMVLLIMTCIL